MKILMVEDDEQLSTTLSRFLSGRGHQVLTERTAAKALDTLQANAADLVICDLHLPDTNGLEFLKTIKINYSDLPVIMTTGDRDLNNAIAAFRLGAFDYLKKPIDLTELTQLLEKLDPLHVL